MNFVNGSIAKGFIPAVNLFVTSRCNMRCRFCFGSCQMQSLLAPREKRLVLADVIRQCHYAGIEKITFVGGEPLLYAGLDEAIQLAHDLGLTTCVVSNGALVTQQWLRWISPSLDWVGFSIDSLFADTNRLIGRVAKGEPLAKSSYVNLVDWVHEAGIRLKVNTTVCQWNHAEDMIWFYRRATPERLKFFQALTIEGVNDAEARSFSVSDEQFAAFVERHTKQGIQVVAESSTDMVGSYLMVSPDGRFFDNTKGCYRFSRPINKVGFDAALGDICVDAERFVHRGGEYDWERPKLTI